MVKKENFAILKKKIIGEFNYTNFQIYGKISSKLNLSITADVLNIVNPTYTIPTKNEKIEDGVYHLIIPISLSKCNQGQYYDKSKYIFFYL